METLKCETCGHKFDKGAKSSLKAPLACPKCKGTFFYTLNSENIDPPPKQEKVLTKPNAPENQKCQEHSKLFVLYCDECQRELCPLCFDKHKISFSSHDVMSIESYQEAMIEAGKNFDEYLSIVSVKVTELEMIVSEGLKIKEKLLDDYYSQGNNSNNEQRDKNMKFLKELFDFEKYYILLDVNKNIPSFDLRVLNKDSLSRTFSKEDTICLTRAFKTWLGMDLAHEAKSIIDQIQFKFLLNSEVLHAEVKIKPKTQPNKYSIAAYKDFADSNILVINEYRCYDPNYKIHFLDLRKLKSSDRRGAIWDFEDITNLSSPRLSIDIGDDISFLYPRARDITHLIFEFSHDSSSESAFQGNVAKIFTILERLKFLRLKIDSTKFHEFLSKFSSKIKYLRKLENFQLILNKAAGDEEYVSSLLVKIAPYLKLKSFELKCDLNSEKVITAIGGIVNNMPERKSISLINTANSINHPSNFEHLMLSPFIKYPKCTVLNLELRFPITKSLISHIAEVIVSNPVSYFCLDFNLPMEKLDNSSNSEYSWLLSMENSETNKIFEPLWSAFERIPTIETFKFKAFRDFSQKTRVDYNTSRLLTSLSQRKLKALQISLLNYDISNTFISYESHMAIEGFTQMFSELKILWVYLEGHSVEYQLMSFLTYLKSAKNLKTAKFHLRVGVETSFNNIVKILENLRFEGTDFFFIFEEFNKINSNCLQDIGKKCPHLLLEVSQDKAKLAVKSVKI